MVPTKLNKPLSKKHGHLKDKPAMHFKRLLDERRQPSQPFTKTFKIFTKFQQASHLVAEIIADNSKPHAEVKRVIFLVCSAIVKKMFATEAEEKIKQIP